MYLTADDELVEIALHREYGPAAKTTDEPCPECGVGLVQDTGASRNPEATHAVCSVRCGWTA